jgi:hypothetical protein
LTFADYFSTGPDRSCTGFRAEFAIGFFLIGSRFYSECCLRQESTPAANAPLLPPSSSVAAAIPFDTGELIAPRIEDSGCDFHHGESFQHVK